MQKVDSKQGFPHGLDIHKRPLVPPAMQNPKRLSELLTRGGNKLTALKVRSVERSLILEHVREALPAQLARTVTSAGITAGRLTIGVKGAVWASRIRYLTESIEDRLAIATGIAILEVRVRVTPHPATADK